MSFRIFFFIFLSFLSGLNAKELKVNINASSAILYNPENGAILYQKNAHQSRSPASLLKIATALFVLEHKKVDLKKEMRASRLALKMIPAHIKKAKIEELSPYLLEHDGSLMRLIEGEITNFHTLLYGLLLLSGNDAANVIAENCSDSIELFMEELNEFLRLQGIENTSFKSPHGFYHPEQFTTAYDMAKITALALKNPIFREIVKTPSYERPASNKRLEPVKMITTNPLLKEGSKFYYPKAIGVKTGYIAHAGYNFAAAAEHEGRQLIAIVLGCKKSAERFQDAIRLFEAAFSEKKIKRPLFSKESNQFTLEISQAAAVLVAELNQDLFIEYFPSEEFDLKAKIHWNPPSLPIRKGEEVGSIEICDEKGRSLLAAPLFSKEHLQKQMVFRALDFFKRFWIFFLGAASLFSFYYFRVKPV